MTMGKRFRQNCDQSCNEHRHRVQLHLTTASWLV